ncbi:MAG TPA: BON domain-containing protein [Opitutaceae bacterium]
MKKLISSVLAAASFASASLAIMSGCAGTPTRESTGEYVDDSAITTKVKAELVRDPIVKAMQVEVTTFKGVVQLSGFVDNANQKAQAEADAKTVNGVKEVKNNITVK